MAVFSVAQQKKRFIYLINVRVSCTAKATHLSSSTDLSLDQSEIFKNGFIRTELQQRGVS